MALDPFSILVEQGRFQLWTGHHYEWQLSLILSRLAFAQPPEQPSKDHMTEQVLH